MKTLRISIDFFNYIRTKDEMRLSKNKLLKFKKFVKQNKIINLTNIDPFVMIGWTCQITNSRTNCLEYTYETLN